MKSLWFTFPALLFLLFHAPVSGAPFGDENRQFSPVPRPFAGEARDFDSLGWWWHRHPPKPFVYLQPEDIRSIDGSGNNLDHPEWGAALIPFLRLSQPEYGDGLSDPAGESRPSAREISNACVAQNHSIPNERGASDYLWQWGQFLDHDITEVPVAFPFEPFDIEVPMGDPYFDPDETGTETIAMNRSGYDGSSAVRQQINLITAYIDASNVYGSDEERAHELRTLDDTGRLKTSEGDLLPFNENGLDNAPSAELTDFFLAGDVRANEQIALIAMHTLFVREHNYWAKIIGRSNPEMSGEEIYQVARSIVAAEMQAITYREFLPVLLGPRAIPRYRGYDPDVNPGIANVFAAAAFRVGHTMLSDELMRLDKSMNEIPAGHIALADSFFDPDEIIEHGIDPVLRGLAMQSCQEIDGKVVDGVRNFLFGPPGSGGFDLASLNIQRGRDHGLAGYNQVRRNFGLRPVNKFSGINSDPKVWKVLEEVYDSVDDIDPWVGMLSEPHVRGAMVGETLQVILADQFRRLRDGDRFYYEAQFNRRTVALINRQTLARIIRRNTGIGMELPGNVFMAPRSHNWSKSKRGEDRR